MYNWCVQQDVPNYSVCLFVLLYLVPEAVKPQKQLSQNKQTNTPIIYIDQRIPTSCWTHQLYIDQRIPTSCLITNGDTQAGTQAGT